MANRIKWEERDRGALFKLVGEQLNHPPEAWARHVGSSDENRGAVSILLRLMEAEVAEPSDKGLLLSHAAIAKLDPSEVIKLGFPVAAPWTVRLEGVGLVTDADFSISHAFFKPDTQQPVLGVERRGVFISVGGEAYTLLDPLYSLVEKADGVNQLAGRDDVSNEDRLLAWAEMRELLPDDAVVGGMLSELDVVRADSFSLSPFVGADGEVDFDLVPFVRVSEHEGEAVESPPDDGKRLAIESLSPSDLIDFQNRFKSRPRVVPSTPLAGGTVLVLSPNAHTAFQKARDIQRAGTREDKRGFVAQPFATLREQLPDLGDDDIEHLFVENEEFSDRVRGIGLWKPAVLPFLTASGVEWLPPEEVGIRVGGVDLGASLSQIGEVEEKIQVAIEAGEATVEIDGHEISANPETLAEIEKLRREIGTRAEAQARKGTEECKASEEATAALVIDDNIEYGLFRRPKERREGIVGVPDGIKTNLLQHQLAGLEWLQAHWLAGTSGALLGDDMGLGKTLQALAFLVWTLNQPGRGGSRQRPMLVVAPSGLLKNWADEAESHLDGSALGQPCQAYGAGLNPLKDTRTATRGREVNSQFGLPLLDVRQLERQTWALTTYETLRDYQFSFGRVHWSVVVFDEAQKIKNPSALMTVAAKALNADFAVTMTGTPVENRVADLWCIVDTCQPGRLGVLSDFVKRFDEAGAEALRSLNEQLVQADGTNPSVLLRRMKQDHLEGLPEKEEKVIDVEMPAAQASAYSEAVEIARDSRGNRGAMLQAIQTLRSISLHPGFEGDVGSDDEIVSGSARFAETVSILDGVKRRREKALVFVESLALQPVLASILQRRYELETLPLIINGSVNGDTRKKRVDAFQQRHGFGVMILSPKAGGVGLTLTAANHVIHLSRWWNPAVENQSTDRVYRIGQEKPVTVHIPRAIHPQLGERSFDVQLHILLERKKVLFNELMMPPELSKSDFEDLFDVTMG